MACVLPAGELDGDVVAAAAHAAHAAAGRNMCIAGSGGGEAALALVAAAAAADVTAATQPTVFVCPGNASTFAVPLHVASLPIDATDVDGLASFALFNDVGAILVLDPRALEAGPQPDRTAPGRTGVKGVRARPA